MPSPASTTTPNSLAMYVCSCLLLAIREVMQVLTPAVLCCWDALSAGRRPQLSSLDVHDWPTTTRAASDVRTPASPSLRVLRTRIVERSTINAIFSKDGRWLKRRGPESSDILLGRGGPRASQYQSSIDRLAAVILVESVSVEIDYGRSLDLSHPSAVITDFQGRPLPRSKDHPNVNAATRKAQEWVSRFSVELAGSESSSLSGWKTLQN